MENEEIYIVVIILKDKGQIIHLAFTDIQEADKYAKNLEPIVRKKRDDFIRCDIVPTSLYISGKEK